MVSMVLAMVVEVMWGSWIDDISTDATKRTLARGTVVKG